MFIASPFVHLWILISAGHFLRRTSRLLTSVNAKHLFYVKIYLIVYIYNVLLIPEFDRTASLVSFKLVSIPVCDEPALVLPPNVTSRTAMASKMSESWPTLTQASTRTKNRDYACRQGSSAQQYLLCFMPSFQCLCLLI